MGFFRRFYARTSIIFLCVAISAIASAGEPMVLVSSRDPSNTLVYAPIAVAAQVQGEASARIIYRPNGRVEKGSEPFSGVPMLLIPLTEQLPNWIVRSNANGGELCQTIVIATFTLGKPTRLRNRKKWKQKTKFATEPNTVRIFVSIPRPEIETVASGAARQGF